MHGTPIFLRSWGLPTPGGERKNGAATILVGDWWNGCLTVELNKTTPIPCVQKEKRTWVAFLKLPKDTKCCCKNRWRKTPQHRGILHLSEYCMEAPCYHCVKENFAISYLMLCPSSMPVIFWMSAVYWHSLKRFFSWGRNGKTAIITSEWISLMV